MKRLTKISALLAVAATAPAVVAPRLVAPAHAQAASEFPDVRTDHWAYDALRKLAAAGVLEGYPPSGNYIGQKPMTRYEFAVAIARVLNKIPAATDLGPLTGRVAALEGRTAPAPTPVDPTLRADINRLQTQVNGLPKPDITRQQVNDLLTALRTEFKDELARVNSRVGSVEARVDAIEKKIALPPRFTTSVAIAHATGTTNYIDNDNGGRNFLGGGNLNSGVAPTSAGIITGRDNDNGRDYVQKKYSYTDFEIRMTDRVTDRLSVNAAVRSLGDNSEDAWAGGSQSNLYLREAYAAADLSDRTALGIKGLKATLGRQRTKLANGLLYDNQLQPTDMMRADFGVGPLGVTAFLGSQGNQLATGNPGAGTLTNNPYATQGSLFYLSGPGLPTTATGVPNPFSAASTPITSAEDDEAAVRISANLFRISGQPVVIGATKVFDGYQYQEGRGLDLTIPLFNRTVGLEIVQQEAYAGGGLNGSSRKPKAGIVTVPVLRTSMIDLNFAYGKADDQFEYFAVSSANPYARSYGEAVFDRPMALGAPLINTSGSGPAFLAAKRTYDVSGTVRLPLGFLRRVPLDFRYYEADSGQGIAPGGGRADLGKVYSLGTTYSLTPGVDLNIKGGIYDPANNTVGKIRYVRVGASVGF